MLPKLDGFQVLQEVNGTPTIFLTAKKSVDDRIKGLFMGADDYLTKPFEMLELVARVEAVLRRTKKNEEEDVFVIDDMRIEYQSKRLFFRNQPVECTPKEFELVEVLIKNRNIALSREKLLELVWGYEYIGETRTVDVHIQKLRKKLVLDPLTASKDKNSTTLRVIKQQGRRYVEIVGSLFDVYQPYRLVYYADVTEMVSGWYKMNCALFIAGMVFSFILSICLYELLKYIFAPLEKISCVSKKIAEGEYKEKLDIKGGNEIAEVVESFNTMSDKIQNQMQSLKGYAEEKQRLIDDMAHELGTPLTAIYGYAEYMLNTHVNEEDKYTFLNYILLESRRLKNISENLLDIAVMREEKEISMQKIDIEQLFRKVHQTESIKLRDKQIQFSYTREIDDLQGNEDLIQSLVMNLLDNAIKASHSKGTIVMSAYLNEGKKVIEIKDNGKGMTKEQLMHVKEAFYRVDKSRSRKEGGNGLGLALCDQIAKKHHAKLVIDSQLGEGTVVQVIFNRDE